MDVTNVATPSSLFEGAASFYAKFRPDYPTVLWDRLAREAALDSSSVVVDLGCGSGAAAFALAPRVAEVVGVDPDGAMLAEAERRAASKGLENIRWVHCRAESFNEEPRDLALIVAASSFHWMDRHRVAELGRRLLRPGGVFAVAGNPNPIVLIRQRVGVGAAIAEVQDRWFGDQPELAPAALVGVEEVFRSCHFKSTETLRFPTQQCWTVDELLGFLCSTSLPPNQRLGDRYTEFATDIERAVLQIEPSGSWLQEGVATLVLARP
jgi:ubiquinone/menaquinone biosynthesis C-methylase UbiE